MFNTQIFALFNDFCLKNDNNALLPPYDCANHMHDIPNEVNFHHFPLKIAHCNEAGDYSRVMECEIITMSNSD